MGLPLVGPCESGRMWVGVLGALEVRGDDDREIDIPGSRRRALLVRLALDAGRPVSVAALVAAVWAGEQPVEEANTLQTLVSRLRRSLGDGALVARSAGGYRLAVDADDVDASRFERLAAAGAAALRAGDPQGASTQLSAALALWRGPTLAEADVSPAVAAHAARLREVYLKAVLDRAEANLAAGRELEVVAALEALAAEHPLHERLAGQLMTALTATGRQADALRTYEQLRARLADELGVDPSAELQAVRLAVLRGGPADSPGHWPARRAAPQARTNLRAPLTTFVGRDTEMAGIAKSLAGNRLVTLVGPGGAGKTRLAGEATARVVDSMPDGVWFVELASVTDPADLPQTVLGVLGLREAQILDRPTKRTTRDAVSRLLEGLADRQAVVVLDNCEHLLDAVARLADLLLARCPRLRVLTTSREPLGIFGEVLLVVPPLAQPAPDAPAADVLGFPAARLFADRAAAVRPGFVVDEVSAPAVIEIVRRLDGLPLAIELAAARLRTLPLAEIAGRLSDRFRLLTGGSRTALPRHRALRAVVEWSWDLLTEPERLLAERLAVFPSGTTTRSAAAVCSGGAVRADDVGDLVAALIDKSLLQPAVGGTRQRMLETIREYGLERLAERGELAWLRERHATYFEELVRTAQPHLTRADQLEWLEALKAERDNILGALRLRCDRGDADAALRIALGIGSLAMLLGNHTDVPGWVAEALAVPGGDDTDLRVIGEAFHAVSSAAMAATSSPAEVETNLARFGELAGRLGSVDIRGWPLIGLLRPGMAMLSGDMAMMERYIEEARAGDDPWLSAAVLVLRAGLAENDGDVERMRADAVTALAEFRALGERWGTAGALRAVAMLHTLDGELDAAAAAYEEALALMGEMGSRDDESMLRIRLADLAMRRGDLRAARGQLAAARAGCEASGTTLETVITLSIQARLERQAGDLAAAMALHTEALRRFDAISPTHPIHGHGDSFVLASAARMHALDGDLAGARARLRHAYPTAVGTKDLPVLAAVGVVVADVAARVGEPVVAAEILGACEALRGSDDPTALDVAELSAWLRGELGDGFAAAYGRGRALDRAAAIARLDPDRLPHTTGFEVTRGSR
ncbi:MULTISPECIES: ATP-binding protein [Protofrankia]|nr:MULTISPECIES: BTAD domain-containing putative transcriptional regulator [Protofrankia]